MKELLRRLFAHPLLAVELGLASLLANGLALASPLFVTQVLNRYVASGVDATLITMTAGVILAIGLELGFRQARLRLALSVGVQRDRDLTAGALGILTTARADALLARPAARRREIIRALATLRNACSASNLVTLLDAPFSLLYLGVLTLLSPPLGLIAIAFVSALLIFGAVRNRLTRKPLQRLQELNVQKEAATHTLCGRIDTLRAFGGVTWARQRWLALQEEEESLRHHLERRQGLSLGIQNALQAMMSVAIIAVGATLAVAGELQVGTLIGANILAARAMGPLLRLTPLSDLLIRAEQALAQLEQFAALAVERDSGSVLKAYRGGLELKDLAKSLPPASLPVFESLSLTLPPGGVLAVSGDDGAGKTVLARLLAGLTDPDRGQILADGVDIAQLSPSWWRRQLIYLPRDPEFLDGTIRENLTRLDPEATPEALNRAITDAGLAAWLDASPGGLETPLADGGHALAPDLRKQLALARALIVRGRLAILDEPTEHLTAKGVLRLYALLRQLSLEGTTLIVLTNDPTLLRAASLVLDLNQKPKPRLINRVAADLPPDPPPELA
ncbi:MAG: ATP-binding cassette domain-containing protein [Magnetococcales bacterium]|nr:ATP-binding cassette domain-containing protein [Magnetococcales bacterium]